MLAANLAAAALGGAAQAQLQLPGAVQGHAPIAGERPRESTTGVPVRAPVEASLTARDLRHKGLNGVMTFRGQGSDLEITRLAFAGERISNPREACNVEVDGGPFTARAQGRREGLKRYAVAIPACPFSFVVLEAAILASVDAAPPPGVDERTAGMCAFTQADCRVHVAGVWGPAAKAISPAEIQHILKARATAEKNALINYRALVAQAGGDRQKVREVAAEQASFSSKRTEQCYDYDGEDTHGFCSVRVTEARAVALRAQLNPAAFEAENSAPRPAPRARAEPHQSAPAARQPPLAAPRQASPLPLGAPAQ